MEIEKSELKRMSFLILSATPPDAQFVALLNRLSEFPQASIAVHHDRYQAGEFPKSLIDRFGLLMVIPEYRTYWSHINNVLATIDGLELLYNQQPQIEWFLTITPACYPIKPIDAIQHFYNGCSYDALIDMHRVGETSEFTELDKFILRDFLMQPFMKIPFVSKQLKFHWKILRKRVSCLPHPYLETYRPWQGSNWFSLNRKVVEKMIREDLKHHALVEFYRHHVVSTPDMHPCPQETVLQTYIGNNPSFKVAFNSYRYINWEGTTDWSPNTLNYRYLEDIKSTEAHWARKFSLPHSSELLNFIEKKILK